MSGLTKVEEQPVRVLEVVGALNRGGTESWLVNVLRTIDRRRFNLHFCVFAEEPSAYSEEVEAIGGQIVHCGLGRNLHRFSQRFRSVVREGRYDVVHSHMHHFSGLVLRLAAKEAVPVRIAHAHNTADGQDDTCIRRGYRHLMRGWIARYATHGLACSHAAAVALFGRAWALDPRFRVLYCGIDLKRFQAPVECREVRHELGIPVDAPVVGHVGRFSPQKNHEGFVSIARIINHYRPEACFLLVGDGPLLETIRATAKAQGLGPRFFFFGSRSDVHRMYAAMDVFLLPSRNEGLPLVLMEAQAAGLPIVATDLPGTREALADTPGNYLFAAPAVEEAATAVVERLPALGCNGHVPMCSTLRFLNRFDIRQCVTDLASLYAAALPLRR
ncbi:MAG: glycosyltransferase [Acidobacteriia bacterium]|nr:glycosyltransferase [Terriglobia bacterium]